MSDIQSQRANEDEFFYRRDRELLEQERLKAIAAAERRLLASATGIADEGVLEDLQVRGYTPATASLLSVAPLVFVAWADGEVSEPERNRILEVARRHGIEENAAAWSQLSAWIEERPAEELLTSTLRALRARNTKMREVLDDATYVASASGGFVGLGPKISSSERLLINQISAVLDGGVTDPDSGTLK